MDATRASRNESSRTLEMNSPLGRLQLVVDDGQLAIIDFVAGGDRRGWVKPGGGADARQKTATTSRHDGKGSNGRLLEESRRQLVAYFSGELREFDLPLIFWGTPFQQAVWRELLNIPYGQTITYAELARRVGRPEAARAAGAACGRNPLSIVVPCHRVVGADGRLTGYAGGLSNKRYLLDLESGSR